jgi:hypothetical protein
MRLKWAIEKPLTMKSIERAEPVSAPTVPIPLEGRSAGVSRACDTGAEAGGEASDAALRRRMRARRVLVLEVNSAKPGREAESVAKDGPPRWCTRGRTGVARVLMQPRSVVDAVTLVKVDAELEGEKTEDRREME